MMNSSLKWKLIAGFILVFVAGAMTGVFFASMHARRMFVQLHQPSLVAARMNDRLKNELKLTPEQVATITPIVNKMATQLEQIRMQTGRRVHETFTDAHQEIAAHLNEDQRKKLEAIQARHHSFHWIHGGHGPPPPGEGSPSP
jgi:hypothetical protein